MALIKKVEGRYDGFKDGEKKEIDELILDDLEFSSLSEEEKKYLEKFYNLIILSANNCGISSLQNLPKLEFLEQLELTENKITGGELKALLDYKQLRKLLLGNNKGIKTLDELKPLCELKELDWLELTGCPVTSIKDYRNEVFKLIPSLEVLDRSDKAGKEVISGDEDDEELLGEEESDLDVNELGKRPKEDSDSDDESVEYLEEMPPKKEDKNGKKKKLEESDDSEDDD